MSAASDVSVDFEEAQELWNDQNAIQAKTPYTTEKRFYRIGRIGRKIWTTGSKPVPPKCPARPQLAFACHAGFGKRYVALPSGTGTCNLCRDRGKVLRVRIGRLRQFYARFSGTYPPIPAHSHKMITATIATLLVRAPHSSR
jgi:hypothetical protein